MRRRKKTEFEKRQNNEIKNLRTRILSHPLNKLTEKEVNKMFHGQLFNYALKLNRDHKEKKGARK